MGCSGGKGGVGNGLGVLLAHLRQLGLCAAHAGLLQPTGQQCAGQRTSGSVGPPWDQIEGHARHTFSIGVRPASAASTRLGAGLRSFG